MNIMPFIHNSWYVASWAQDLTDAGPTGVTIIDEPLVLFRTCTGEAVALRDCCCHRNAPLSHGRCEGGLLRCMYHGLLFDGNGKCVNVPGQKDIPERARVRSYPTAELGDFVWVWMGEPELANRELIPLPLGFQTEGWEMRRSHADMEANYSLMTDNLADMSHVAYLHEASFGGGDTRIAETHPTISTLDRGLRIERWLSDRGRVEDWLPDGSRAPIDTRQDLWLSYDLLLPGIFVMKSEIHAAGVARTCGYMPPSVAPLHSNLNVQAVTPIAECRTRHFFALGPPASEAGLDSALPDVMFEIMIRGFHEDRRMLEAQQRNLRRWNMDSTVAIRHDRGTQLLRHMMTRLLEQERPKLTGDIGDTQAGFDRMSGVAQPPATF
jgi:phenylpropionate dioxygenase-like ring-hydroxylating dioxygenase large terminal subunit